MVSGAANAQPACGLLELPTNRHWEKKVNLMRRKLTLVLGSVAIIAGCGQVTLVPKTPSPQDVTTQSTFCSMPNGQSTDVLKILFIVDMSGSNIQIGTTPNSGTDVNGARFQLINNFLNADCANKNPNNQFGVIGFSMQAYTTPANSCNKVQLGGASLATTQLANLKGIQDTAKQDPIYQQTMTQTMYMQGFQCAQNIIADDIKSLTASQRKNTGYMVYFLTDGAPTDFMQWGGTGVDIIQEKAALGPILDTMVSNAQSQAGGLRISPINYGFSKLDSQDQLDATTILDFIASKGDSYRTTVDDVNQVNFCSILQSGSHTQYTVKKFGAINLTALKKRNRLIPDSDMDGIPDEEEIARGFDPKRARSQYHTNGNLLLDGLCPAGLSANQCPVRTSCSNPNSFGFSDCDVQARGLTDGLDYDHDEIPDLIEILKGTDEKHDDTNTDNDGDGTYLWQEIATGRDPNFDDTKAPVDPATLIKMSVNLMDTPAPNCGTNQQSWSFTIDQMPVVHTLNTIVDDPVSSKLPWLSHKADENVILLYYIVGKSNDDPQNPAPPLIYGQFLKVNYWNGTLPVGEFKQLGVNDGNFVPVP